MDGKKIGAGLLGLVLVLCARVAVADWLTAIPSAIARDFKRRACWPQPFTCPDRQAVREPFAIMVSNGWTRQNTVGDYHFEPGASELTEAGKLKVRWIALEAPSQHRAVFVQRSTDPELTRQRMAAVERFVASLTADGSPAPPVLLGDGPPAGWPADRVDTIGRKFQSSTPDPRLPTPQGETN